MMVSLEKVNEFLAKVGSDYRATLGEPVGPALDALFAALPGYIDRREGREMKLLHETSAAAGYSCLLLKFHKAAISKDKGMMERIDASIALFEELWPEETAAWRRFAMGDLVE